MLAQHINGDRYVATAYNTSTVTLATRSGRPDVVAWAEIDHLIGDDGLRRHRDVVDGIPKIIVQPVNIDPCWVPCPTPPTLPSNLPQSDFEDAIALIDLIDNDDAREAVREALRASFEGQRKRELWDMLSKDQKARLQ